MDRARVADTGCAAVTNQVESDFVEVFLQSCGLEVFADDLRAGGQRCFHPRFPVQTQGCGFACHQTSADHDVGVGRVGARRNRSNHNVTRGEGVILASDGDFFVHGALERLFHFIGEGRFCVGQRDIILWPFGAGNCRNDCAHIQMQRVCVDRCVIRIAPKPIFLSIGFDQCDPIFVAARVAQVAQGFTVNGEETAGRPIFGCHISNGRPVSQWQHVQTCTVEFDEFANNAKLAQHFHNLQHKVGAGGPFDHLAGQLKAHNFGDQHGYRLAQHRRLGLDPAHAPAQNGKAVDHGCMRVGPDERVRVGHFFAVLIFVRPNGLGQIFEVHLVANASARRHNPEVVKRALAPF